MDFGVDCPMSKLISTSTQRKSQLIGNFADTGCIRWT